MTGTIIAGGIPTLRGIRDGRDDVLERAIDFLRRVADSRYGPFAGEGANRAARRVGAGGPDGDIQTGRFRCVRSRLRMEADFSPSRAFSLLIAASTQELTVAAGPGAVVRHLLMRSAGGNDAVH